MKKLYTLFLACLILIFFFLNTTAQSSQGDLDQVRLMKQFIGTWTTELGKDTIIYWEITPLEMGFEHVINMEIKGNKHHYLKAIGGFTSDYKNAIWYGLRPNGKITRDIG